jgi:phospholipid/cholesterol/gamma-HCH transport system ATP-binding protein
VTHERQLAFGIADRIAVMTRGRILTIGTPEEIRGSTEPEVSQFLNADLKLVTQENMS